MIIKDLLEYETARGPVLAGAAACRHCTRSCGACGAVVEPPAGAVARQVTLAVDSRGLHTVVAVLFGAPLLVMICAVTLMQSFGFAERPLTCLAMLVCLMAISAKIIAPYGVKLLDILQVQRLPASHGRNTA